MRNAVLSYCCVTRLRSWAWNATTTSGFAGIRALAMAARAARPRGRRYLLLNSELCKTVYDAALFPVQLGPFFDTGAIADPSGLFASQKWLFDTGIQARVRVLGSVSVLLSYGRDLRSGTGAFYSTSVH
jgi:hypothetical protein